MNIRDEALAARTLLSAMAAEQDEVDDEDAELVVASETNLLEAIEAALLANAEDAAGMPRRTMRFAPTIRLPSPRQRDD